MRSIGTPQGKDQAGLTRILRAFTGKTPFSCTLHPSVPYSAHLAPAKSHYYCSQQLWKETEAREGENGSSRNQTKPVIWGQYHLHRVKGGGAEKPSQTPARSWGSIYLPPPRRCYTQVEATLPAQTLEASHWSSDKPGHLGPHLAEDTELLVGSQRL